LAWFTVFQIVGQYLLNLFIEWIKTIFVEPFATSDMLWLLVPVWLAWAFAEFFQEKIGTSMGNAISNAVIVLWGSIDCTRQTVKLILDHDIIGTINIIIRFSIIGAIFIYGVIIVILGWKGNKIIKRIGRIRNVTYVFVMFVPVFYGSIALTWNHVVASVLFFPLFYFAIEFIDWIIPDPKAIIEDIQDIKDENGEKPKVINPALNRPNPQMQYQQRAQYPNNNVNYGHTQNNLSQYNNQQKPRY
jgi:hypothetical protein